MNRFNVLTVCSMAIAFSVCPTIAQARGHYDVEPLTHSNRWQSPSWPARHDRRPDVVIGYGLTVFQPSAGFAVTIHSVEAVPEPPRISRWHSCDRYAHHHAHEHSWSTYYQGEFR